MNLTLKDRQRVIVFSALKRYYAWLGSSAPQTLYDKEIAEVIWLIDRFDLTGTVLDESDSE